MNTLVDLKNENYTFNSNAGTFANRFEIVYQPSTLGQDTQILNSNAILIHRDQNSIIINAGVKTISDIKMYDISGRLVLEKNAINSSVTSVYNASSINEVLFISITFTDGQKISKKILLQN